MRSQGRCVPYHCVGGFLVLNLSAGAKQLGAQVVPGLTGWVVQFSSRFRPHVRHGDSIVSGVGVVAD